MYKSRIIYKNNFREVQHFDKNLVLIEHEVMGPKLTHAEGMILGTAAKMFAIAGPVIVYGVSASVVYGFVYWISAMLG